MILLAIYLNVDGHRLYNWFLRQIPEVYQSESVILLIRLKTVWEQFFVGQVILIISMGLLVWIGGAALGLPDAFPLAVIAGLLEIIPVVGPILAAIPAVIVALLQGSTYLPVNTFIFALIVIGFYLLVNAIVNNLIYPILLGEVIDLHPMIVFTGVIVGATEAGLLGALLAPAVIASAREILRYLYRKMWGEDPFPPNEAPIRASFSWAELRQIIIKIRGLRRRAVPPPPEAP
jgi:predicted PurR-regulated permease PerM